MKLEQLVMYAKEKYQIEEEYKWPNFPEFSVLCHPKTGKWIALLMRQWDSKKRKVISRCDLKCGTKAVINNKKTYLSSPVRMKGKHWLDIVFDKETEEDLVYYLFDQAFSGETKDITIVLNPDQLEDSEKYKETALPFRKRTKNKSVATSKSLYEIDSLNIPEKIRDMINLYEFGTPSMALKAKNFYKQGKFMEKYEDDKPWTGEFKHYFTTYHDLNLSQLRGYFTWRSFARKEKFQPIAISLAYLYLYELLNGIGTTSPEDTLYKLKKFQAGFLAAGFGDNRMVQNLQNWMLDFAVLHGIPIKDINEFANLERLSIDSYLSILKNPEKHSDESLYTAICFFGPQKLEQSPIVLKDEKKAKHLFAGIWRYLSSHYDCEEKSLFDTCFGEIKSYRWQPFSNVVYWNEEEASDKDILINDCHSYHCRKGVWTEKRYEKLYFDKSLFHGIFHESDRIFRKVFKTGRYLHKKLDEAWVTPYVEKMLEAERMAQLESSISRISIDFSELNKIREDALQTRENLLIEEELTDNEFVIEDEVNQQTNNDVISKNDKETMPSNGLNTVYLQILHHLLTKQPIEGLLNKNYLMPSIVADTINEIFFDEIGDTILDYDGNSLSLVEDYRTDIIKIMEAKFNGQ